MFYYFREIGNRWDCILQNINHPLPDDVNFQCGSDIDHPNNLTPAGDDTVTCNDGNSFPVKVFTDSSAISMREFKCVAAIKVAKKKASGKKVTKKNSAKK